MPDRYRAALEHAERQLLCADMIDDNGRRAKEMAYWRGRIDALQREIAAAEAPNDPTDPFNPHGSGPLPITPREGQD